MNKTFKIIGITVVILLLIYLSLDIQNLETARASNTSTVESPEAFAENFWEGLPVVIENAMEIDRFLELADTDPAQVFEQGNQLGISNTFYYMLKGTGQIVSVEDEDLIVSINNTKNIRLATGFIFGNAVRDGSGVVNIDDFLNMTSFNNVSLAINQLVKDSVASALDAAAEPGMLIQFAGATEIRSEEAGFDNLRIIPVSFTLSDGVTQ